VGSGKENFHFSGLRNVGCVKLCSENFNNLFYLPNIAWVMQSKRMGALDMGKASDGIREVDVDDRFIFEDHSVT
jgi:hypothetical protein